MDRETKEMFEILHQNKKNITEKEAAKRQLFKDQKDMKKEQKKQIIKTIIFVLLILIWLVILIFFFIQEDKEFMKHCVNNGLSEMVCRRAS